MTATTTKAVAERAQPHHMLTFRGILVSEWIKLRTLRSTVWCYAVAFAITVAFGLLIAAVMSGNEPGGDPQFLAVLVTTSSVGFSQLVVCVLGVLVMTGEYGTGMIRSTFTAVPQRLPALAAKIVVFAVVTFVVSVVAFALTAVLTAPILTGAGTDVDLTDSGLLLALLGASLYLTGIGALSLAIGALIRNSAGGIAAAIGLVLVVPTLLQLMGRLTQSTLTINAASFTPSESGSAMYNYGAAASSSGGPISLDQVQGGLVLLAWVIAVSAIAAVALKRRDV